jgi:SAM-dependent methyltransferase
MYRSLKGILSSEDSSDKKAVVISGSDYLARLVGLHRTKRIALNYPEFTAENLPLRSDSYDFVISDQVLEHCRDIADVANETMRILKPGGWFVHTTCFINVVHGAPSDFWRFTPAGLAGLFPHATDVKADGWGNRVATILMETGRRLLPVPEDANNPIHQVAVHNEPNWPISTWVHGRKSFEPTNIAAAVHSRKAAPRSYVCKPKNARFGVVACARNEAPYLLEWIAHYRVLGFEQITIYDNESNDASFDILEPLSKSGSINAIYWRPEANQNKQVSAYNDAVRRLRDSCEWCLFVDLDEFLLLDEGFSLSDILPRDPTVRGVGIPWRIYGSNGREYRDTGLTIERFTKSAARNNSHVKSLVRLRDVKYMNVHVPELASGRLVDLEGREISYECRGKLDWIANGPARINHYFCRSAEEFEYKRARGRGAVSAAQPDAIRSLDIYKTMDQNEVESLQALRMVPAIKEEIAQLRKLIGK